jgi:hypothetical protein
MTDPRPYVMELLKASQGLSRYEKDKRITWAFPQLSLRVYADSEGVHVFAIIQSADGKGILRTTELARAVFVPRDVTERLVVEWGARALEAWLSTQVPPS